MFWWLFGKKEVDRVQKETKKGFENVKKDMDKLGMWITYLNSEKDINKKDIKEIKGILSTIKKEVEEVKEIMQSQNREPFLQIKQTPKQLSKKQTAVYPVQTAVWTAVQTPNFDQFSVSERAIIWVLLNTDMKLSYDDLAAITNKEKSTVRGQINSIKQKSEGLIKEFIEKNGKKRLYIPKETKNKLLEKQKVSVGNKKNKKKS